MTETAGPRRVQRSNAVRVMHGFVMLSLNATVGILGQLCIVPVAMLGWGEARYGEWVTLTGLITLLKLADLGLQTYVVNRMCAEYARADYDQLHHVMFSALRVQVPIAIAIFATSVGFFAFAPVGAWLGLRTVGTTELQWLGPIMTLELLLTVPMGIVYGLYRATGNLDRHGLNGMLQAAAQMIVTIGLVWMKQGFRTVIVARVLVTLLVYVWIIRDLKRLLPWLKIGRYAGRVSDGVAMIAPGLLFLIFPLADFLSGQVAVVLLQKTASGVEVSRLATHRTVINAAQMCGTLVVNTAWMELARLHVQSPAGHLMRARASLVKLHVWLVSGIAIGVLPLLPHIYSSWTLGHLQVDWWTIAFLVTRTILWGYWYPSMTVLLATNRHRTAALVVAAASVIASLGSAWLVPIYGIRGAALAQLLADVLSTAWLIPLLAYRDAGGSLLGSISEVGRVVAGAILMPAGMTAVTWMVTPEFDGKYLILPFGGALLSIWGLWRELVPEERVIVREVTPCWIRTMRETLHNPVP